jgi:hypothetical protein
MRGTDAETHLHKLNSKDNFQFLGYKSVLPPDVRVPHINLVSGLPRVASQEINLAV